MKTQMINPKILGIVLATTLISFSSFTAAFNITRLLDQHPDFGNFNSLLSATGVADAINDRQTITVLAVDDSAIQGLNGKDKSIVRGIIATHVVLDYYDLTKLTALSKNKSAVLTTLYQSTGMASGRQGFLNVTVSGSQISFGSAVKGAQQDSQLIKIIAAQPFNISVIQVSSVIIPPGMDDGTRAPPSKAPPPRKVGPPAPAPSPSSAPAPAPGSEPAAADSPADDDSPADAPDDDSDSPASGPAPGPADDEAADKKEPKKKSGASQLTSGGLLLAAMVAAVAVLL